MLKGYFRISITVLVWLAAIPAIGFVLYAWNFWPFKDVLISTKDAYVKGQIIELQSEVDGTVRSLLVKDYDQVDAGETLLTLTLQKDDKELQELQAELFLQKKQRANLLQTISEVEKSVENKNKQKQIDTNKMLVELESGLKKNMARLQLLQEKQEKMKIISPVNAQISSIFVTEGQKLFSGTHLINLVTKNKWIIANFKETVIFKIKLGQQVDVRIDALKGNHFIGYINQISPVTSTAFSPSFQFNTEFDLLKTTQSIPVRIDFAANQKGIELLKPGMSAEVFILSKKNPL